MLFEFISDLHTEHHPIDFSNINPKSEILVLAGDIGNLNSNNLKPLFDCITKKWKYIIYVLGNHEFMYIDKEIDEIKIMYKNFCKQYNNVYLLDNEVVEIDGTVFIGSILWSSIPHHLREYAESHLSDFRKIKSFIPKSQGYYLYSYMHMIACHFIETNLQKYSSQNKKIVVVTHHAPYKCGTSKPHHESNEVGTCGYASDLSFIFKEKNLSWIFGHTHYKCNFDINDVKICSNPYGNDPTKLLCVENLEI